MTLSSMTGFARRDGSQGALRWHWEVRSVNGRGLDVRMRLPPGYEALEVKARETVTKRLTRGNVAVSLSVQRDAVGGDIRLNEAALSAVLTAIDRVKAATDCERPRPEGILALRGVLEISEAPETEAEAEARQAIMLADLEAALTALIAARASEGARLAVILSGQLDQIEQIVRRVTTSPAREPAAIRQKLEEQLRRLIEASPALDPARLHQEAALIATRADIEEELARLGAHIAAAREMIAAREPVGRKLDFLAQEFNREANTLCSKANAVDITRSGLDLKAVIDQLREQVQNIE